MIWFDVVVILLLTLRMVFLDERCHAYLTQKMTHQRWQATRGRRRASWLPGEEDESLQLSEIWLHDAGSSAITYSCNA
jgi:hypothetical protein